MAAANAPWEPEKEYAATGALIQYPWMDRAGWTGWCPPPRGTIAARPAIDGPAPTTYNAANFPCRFLCRAGVTADPIAASHTL